MALTVTAALSNIAGLSITGVTMVSQPPATMPSGNVKIGWPRLPDGRQGSVSFTSAADIDHWTLELVVLAATVGVNTNAVNHAAVATVMDNINAALKTEAAANNQIDSYEMTGEQEQIGTSTYWVVTTIIEMSG